MKLSQWHANTQHISNFHPFQRPMNCHFPSYVTINSFIVTALQNTSNELFSTIHLTTSVLENHMHSYDHEQRHHKYSAGIKWKIHGVTDITKKKKEHNKQKQPMQWYSACKKRGKKGPMKCVQMCISLPSLLRIMSAAKCAWFIISIPVLSNTTTALLWAATSASNAWCFWIFAWKMTWLQLHRQVNTIN